MTDLTTRIEQHIAELLAAGCTRMVLSKPAAGVAYRRAELTLQQGKAGPFWQLARYTDKQVFHENIAPASLAEAAAAAIAGQYGQLNGWSADTEYTLLISKKGQTTLRRSPRKGAEKAAGSPCPAPAAHDRQKNYLLAEGTPIPPLVDMGVFTPDGRVVKARYDKFRQINRFIEIIDDAIRDKPPASLNIIDFGCGKSYLTFLVYHYLTAVKGIRVQAVGLDLKAEVIAHCNEAAARYGYTGLHFELGDINGYTAPWPVDMVLTLHACDTATDYALYNALQWNAGMIFSVPCCQHELNGQMAPDTMTLLGRYGIIRERFAALATDAIRGRLLEAAGYRTQLLEFIDLDHTPKNLLIRAIRRPSLALGGPLEAVKSAHAAPAIAEVRALCREFGFTPTLAKLLKTE